MPAAGVAGCAAVVWPLAWVVVGGVCCWGVGGVWCACEVDESGSEDI